MAVKLVTETERRHDAIALSVDDLIAWLKEYRDRVDGVALIAIMKDGGNHIHYTPIEDTLKMIGAIDYLKLDTALNYNETSTCHD